MEAESTESYSQEQDGGLSHKGAKRPEPPSFVYKIFMVGFCFSCTSLSAGIVYGWPALRRQLLQDNTSLSDSQLGICYTVGAWSTQGCRFLTGMARDRYGTRHVACFCFLCVFCGFLGLAFADPSSILALSVSLFCVGLGSGVQLCLQPVAGYFPEHAGSILASLSGAFQISGMVFLGITASTPNRKAGFLAFAGVLFLLLALSYYFLPEGKSFVEENGPHDISSEAELVAENETDAKEPTRIRTIRSLEYMLLVTWFSVVITPLQYYIGSLGFQLEDKGDDTGKYADLFTIIYGCSAVAAPVIGFISDQYGVGAAQGIATSLAAISFFVFASDATLSVQIISLTTNALGRMFVFGMFFAHIGKRLGYHNFGTLAGLGLLISAVVSILQYPLIDAAARGQAKGMNLLCAACTTVTLPYCFWLSRKESIEKR